jgi:hypothetical protein
VRAGRLKGDARFIVRLQNHEGARMVHGEGDAVGVRIADHALQVLRD